MFALLLTLAHAATYPVVVRLDPGAGALEVPVTVTLTADGRSETGTLADDGQRPDVEKGDGRWAGVVHLDGVVVQVALSAGGKALGTGSVTFASADAPRDLDLRLENGALVVSASTPNGEGPPADVSGTTPPPPDGSATGAAGGPPPGSPSQPPGSAGSAAGGAGVGPGGDPGARGPGGGGNVQFPTQASDNGLLFIGFGVGLLVLLGLAWVWTQQRERVGPPPEVTRLPEQGLLHPQFPSLSDGLTVWTVPPEARDILQPLLAHLADHHRVLLIGRGNVQVQPVHGGPVYRLVGVKPSLAGDVAEALSKEPGPVVVALMVLESNDGEALRDYRDLLPRDVGGIAVVPVDTEHGLPKVAVRARDRGWEVTSGDVTVYVVAGQRGLDVVAPGSIGA